MHLAQCLTMSLCTSSKYRQKFHTKSALSPVHHCRHTHTGRDVLTRLSERHTGNVQYSHVHRLLLLSTNPQQLNETSLNHDCDNYVALFNRYVSTGSSMSQALYHHCAHSCSSSILTPVLTNTCSCWWSVKRWHTVLSCVQMMSMIMMVMCEVWSTGTRCWTVYRWWAWSWWWCVKCEALAHSAELCI